MIDNHDFFDFLQNEGIQFFTGVPDSLLKHFCAFVADNADPARHVITANEGGAVALATGHHLATGNIPLVYMQNSGLGNAVNPLLSLADPEVYGIPMVLMIGWRAEPGVKDEPQHVKQGRIQNDLLQSMEIPFEILSPDEPWADKVRKLVKTAKKESKPVAIVVKKGTFDTYNPPQKPAATGLTLSREYALEMLIDNLDDNDVIVSTTGMCSREIFELRARKNAGHHRDFLTVGSMGHCSQIALGIAMEKPGRNIWCIDGDGALIMHMGALSVIASRQCPNFRHVVINNGAHDSVGGQPTTAFEINIPAIAEQCGYKHAKSISSADEVPEAVRWLQRCQGPSVLEIKVHKGARSDLGRPTRTPAENKKDFMNNLSNNHD